MGGVLSSCGVLRRHAHASVQGSMQAGAMKGKRSINPT